MTTSRTEGRSFPQRHRAVRLTGILASAFAALLACGSPARAARECERPDHAPAVGACARLAAAELFHYDLRPDGAASAEAVIFLHAASGNADAFRFNLEAFRTAGYRAVAYDRRNVGRSSNTRRDDELGRSRGSTVRDLDDLVERLGIDRFHLVGVAAGAQVALQYAAAGSRRDRVQSLVLAATLGPPGLAENEPTLAELQRNIALPFEVFCPMAIAGPPPAPLRLVNAATAEIPEVRAEHRELGTRFRATDRAGVEAFNRIADDARHRTFDGCRSANVGANQPGLAAADPRNPDTFAKVASLVTQRTLLLAGTGDVFFSPPVQMRLWGSYLRDAQYVQLDTGHAPQFEDPAGFNAAVLRFIAGGQPFERATGRR